MLHMHLQSEKQGQFSSFLGSLGSTLQFKKLKGNILSFFLVIIKIL